MSVTNHHYVSHKPSLGQSQTIIMSVTNRHYVSHKPLLYQSQTITMPTTTLPVTNHHYASHKINYHFRHVVSVALDSLTEDK